MYVRHVFFMYKCMQNDESLPAVFHGIFILNSSIHSFPTRQASYSYRQFSHTVLGHYNIRSRGPILFPPW